MAQESDQVRAAKRRIQQAREAGDRAAEAAALARLRRLRAEEARAALAGDGETWVWPDERDRA